MIQPSLVNQLALLPLLLFHELNRIDLGVRELAVLLPIQVVTHHSYVFIGEELYELALPNVVLPDTLLYFILFFVEVFPPSFLFVVEHLALKGVAVAVSNLSSALNFIVLELSLVLLFKFIDVHFSQPFLFILDKLASILIAISVIESSFAPKVSVFELSNILFILESQHTVSMLFVLEEISFILQSRRLF